MRPKRVGWIIASLLFLMMAMLVSLLKMPVLSASGSVSAQSEGYSSLIHLPLVLNGYLLPSQRLCRFGVGGQQSIGLYNVNALRLGWYIDWTATLYPASPGGIGYMPMVRLSQTGPNSYAYTPSEARLLQIAANQPGATWLVGNEPDRRTYQDDLEPHVYAMAYHHLYHLIKTADPTAKIAAGGIVQPTPLRLQYLDMMLDSYVNTYDTMMPVDVWNIHAFILREEVGSWGADIPPGIDVAEGELFEIDDNGNVEIFEEGIRRFRHWMADNGYRERPLIITEYGIQMPEDFGFTPERVRTFMYDTFDYLSIASDPLTGYSADNDRLVQQWAWYSLTDSAYNGWLYDATTRERTVHGDSFAAYAADLPAAVNLATISLGVDSIHIEAGRLMSVTLAATIVNNGNMTSPSAMVAFYLGDPLAGGELIALETLPELGGCAEMVTVDAVWTSPTEGDHLIYVVADAQNRVHETDEIDNVLSGTISLSVTPSLSMSAR